LRGWIEDIADRMQCPPDYLAVTAMVAAGTVVGRRIGIRPQEWTDWVEVPNLWGWVIGHPGVMKSPAMAAALGPIRRLEARAAAAHELAEAAHAVDAERFKIGRDAATAKAKRGDLGALDLIGPPPAPPVRKRYIVNDTSYEKLGEVMAENPYGVLVFRDELVSLLRPLDREENAAARGFYLSAWNGKDDYTFDRITRGHTHIEACCLSVLGATQPARLAAYLKDAVRGGNGADGFAQRFGLLAWPDVPPSWQDVDRWPDSEARRSATVVFERLDTLTPEAVGAEVDRHDPIPFLRFAPAALKEFRNWREALEPRLRGGELPDALTAHLNKYRGLAPKLALLIHLIDGEGGPVGQGPTIAALGWIEYLETHAVRAYAAVTAANAAAARAILNRIKRGELGPCFTARDVYRKQWSGLTDRQDVVDGLEMLAAFDWLAAEDIETGGRRSTLYHVNPNGVQP
jgi:hypothetical protein